MPENVKGLDDSHTLSFARSRKCCTPWSQIIQGVLSLLMHWKSVITYGIELH